MPPTTQHNESDLNSSHQFTHPSSHIDRDNLLSLTSTARNEERTDALIVLPRDSFSEILCRLPVRDLMLLKCVSKPWLAFIDSIFFIEFHSKFNKHLEEVLISDTSYDSYKRRRFSLLSTNKPITLFDTDIFKDAHNFPENFNFFDCVKQSSLAGSVNGIVVLRHYKNLEKKVLVIWNPATMFWKPIRIPSTRHWKDVSVGLGVDSSNDDYKVVCIVPSCLCDGTSRVEIFSLKNDSWDANSEDRIIPLWAGGCRSCKFLKDGVPFWTGRDKHIGSQEILACIDPSTGRYSRYAYPEHAPGNPVFPVKLREEIGALIMPYYKQNAYIVDLYMLSLKDSKWTKYSRIGPIPCTGFLVPQAQSVCGHMVFLKHKISNLAQFPYLYNLANGQMKRYTAIKDVNPMWTESFSHVQTLVCLNGMVSIRREHINSIVLKTGAHVIAGKVRTRSVDSGAPLSEQTQSGTGNGT